MRVFVQKAFGKWATDEGIDDETLIETAEEAFAGEHEADLGGYLYKKRIAREDGGKSGGYRTILCFRKKNSDRIYFMVGFAKNAKDNISLKEKAVLRAVAKEAVDATNAQIEALKERNAIRELTKDDPK